MKSKSTLNLWKKLCGTVSVIITLNASTAAQPLNIIKQKDAFLKQQALDSMNQLVLLEDFIQPLFVDFKYATINNFTNQILYKEPAVIVIRKVAIALQKIQEELKAQNLSLLFYDSYRPYTVTEKMWEIVPDERYAANPKKGSAHNKSIAVDVGIINLQTKTPLVMPSDYDEFSIKAHHNYEAASDEAIHNRNFLRKMMEKYGFVALETEWWHYSFPNNTNYPLFDIDFKELKLWLRN